VLGVSQAQSDETVEALSEQIAVLRRPALHLREGWLHDSTVLALSRRAPNLACLVGLSVLGVAGSAGLEALLGSPMPPRLRWLRLVLHANHAEKALRVVAELSFPGRLRHLELRTCYGELPVGGLADWPGLRRLDTLDLGHSRCPDADLRALAGSPYLSPLTRLTLADRELSPALLSAFRERLGPRFSTEVRP
jgi:hypothetical protein